MNESKTLEIRAIINESLDGEVTSLPVSQLTKETAATVKAWAVYEVNGQCLTSDFPELVRAELWLATELASNFIEELATPITRDYYMDHSKEWNIHARYYSQFCSEYVLSVVSLGMGLKNIIASKDSHFNDIPLAKWDALVTSRGCFGSKRLALSNATTEANKTPSVSLSDRVSAAKTAARMLRELYSI